MWLRCEEIKNLLHDTQGRSRPSQQVLGLISRRVDYVRENVSAATKRLDKAEESLTTFETLTSLSKDKTPVAEIVEELDEDDNVISSSLSTPGQAGSNVLDTLRRAGIPISTPKSEEKPATGLQSVEPSLSSRQADDRGSTHNASKATLMPSISSREVAQSTKSNERVSRGSPPIDDQSTIKSGGTLSPTSDSGRPKGTAQIDESPEDAQLRREMLEYSMNEVGAVVAEMNLAQGNESDMSDIEDGGEFGEETDGDDCSDEEDGFGRATGKLIDEGYRNSMLELERKLNAKALINSGPRADENGTKAEPVSKQDDRPAEKSKKTAKGVRFADTLDIQEAPRSESKAADNSKPERPIASSVVERGPTQQTSHIQPDTSQKRPKPNEVDGQPASNKAIPAPQKNSTSKVANGPLAGVSSPTSLALPAQFSGTPLGAAQKPQQTEQPKEKPEHLAQTTHGDALERQTQRAGQEVVEPDQLDPLLIRQEVATDYNRMRNRMIQRNGGFTSSMDEDEIPVNEQGRKMSRFKAARISNAAM